MHEAAELAKTTGLPLTASNQIVKLQHDISTIKAELTELQNEFKTFQTKVIKIVRMNNASRARKPDIDLDEIERQINSRGKRK